MDTGFPVRFGKYALLEKIATGGMAELYRAMIVGAQGFEKLVAIKRILPHLTDQPELVDAFIDEAKLAALLQHPNIVQIYDFGCIEGAYFLAMEHLFGRDLHSILAQSREKGVPFGLEHGLYVVSKVCEGMEYAHKLKDLQGNPLHLIHRDINPANVLVTYDGEVKIVDFGIAKAAGKTTKTREGLIKGKVAYMSPEQASGKPIDHRSDLFSTGVILYEMLTGKMMFQGEDLGILIAVQEARFEPPERIKPDLPPRVCEILHRALHKDPDLRYQSGAEMLADLEECIHASAFRLTFRTMAQYMKALFREEIEKEEKSIGRISQLSPQAAENANTPSRKTIFEKTRLLRNYLSDKMPARRLRWYGLTLLSLISFLLIVSRTGSPLWELAQSSVPMVRADFPRSTHDLSKIQSADRAVSHKIDSAKAALENEQVDEAVALLEEVISTNPDLAPRISALYSQALTAQALRASSKNPEKVEPLLLKALQKDPNNVRARFELGSLYLARHDYSKAIRTYRNVIGRDPQFHRAMFNLAYAYASKKEYSRAEQMYRRVIELSPPYEDEALFNLAIVQAKQGKTNQSIASLEKALIMNPNNKDAKNYLQKLRERKRS
jgi:serine/threonine protein kinase/cytochrome c-type biogenesis protein CcmH/NrfG